MPVIALDDEDIMISRQGLCSQSAFLSSVSERWEGGHGLCARESRMWDNMVPPCQGCTGHCQSSGEPKVDLGWDGREVREASRRKFPTRLGSKGVDVDKQEKRGWRGGGEARVPM